MTSASPTPDPFTADLSRLPADGGSDFNRLVFEKSPYLLQHATNPVDWYPWGEKAMALARERDCPLLVSIGYSTCHWCHVMAHESFADPEVAAVINRLFVPVKVDREERPDLDATFMQACQLLSGRGGWPLNVLLTPDLHPFFAATYLPKEPLQGMAGIVAVLEHIGQLWHQERPRIREIGTEMARALATDIRPAAAAALERTPLAEVILRLQQSFDSEHGGFGPAPKFPLAHTLSLLLRLAPLVNRQVAEMAYTTLEAIHRGGITDQLGGGIHRYAVDARWRVPHFEKMLYDQALLLLAAVDGVQAGGPLFLREMIDATVGYLLRDLRLDHGGFACGEDADSQGEEGVFYTWTPEEVAAEVGTDQAEAVCRLLGVTAGGDLEGRSILHLQQLPGAEEQALLAALRPVLLAARNRRVRPHRDDKVVTAWNGLAIAALARAGAVLQRPAWIDAARQARAMIANHLYREDRLLRRYRDGEAAIPAFLEDYACLAWGDLELYLAEFVPADLERATALCRAALELFGDGAGGVYDTGRDVEAVLGRGRTRYDGAQPAGVSVLTLCLLRLGRLWGEGAWREAGETLLQQHMALLQQVPDGMTQMLQALDLATGEPWDLVLAASDRAAAAPLLAALREGFYPQLLVQLTTDDTRATHPVAALREKQPQAGHSTAWLCRGDRCLPPITAPAALRQALSED